MHLGFHPKTSAKIVETASHARISVREKMIGPLHDLLATHEPAQYFSYCDNWTNRLERVALEATKSRLSQDKIGPAFVKDGIEGPVRLRTKIGALVDALAFKVFGLDATLVDEIFPGLNQAVALLYDTQTVDAYPTEMQAQAAIDRMLSLYTFLTELKVASIEVPPLSD